ncbi:hypothetical protein [Gluconobacter oxydans]|uniref:hypothetical protein n=1 Tax=Gluconobacter oxydans TaxID=442 RepID=UPI001CD8E879|nr:hypothetical protein [Gluconobacter oxydans]
MDWQSLQQRYDAPHGASARAARLLALGRVLDGTMYDVLPHDFSSERSGAGEYIPLSNRRPSVRTNLCRTVVDDSVSLLFGDTHWPEVKATDPQTAEALGTFIREAGIKPLFVQTATRGAVGSVAILLEALEGRLIASVLETVFLTPEWDAGGTLLSVRERYVVRGRDLAAQGYSIPDEQLGMEFWWQRTFTQTDCEVLLPLPVGSEIPAAKDERRSVRHGLGFVPIVWIRNLCSASHESDGLCTFERAIVTCPPEM